MEIDDGDDETWIVRKARSCPKTDTASAKAWLVVGRTLFPRNFDIQFQTYLLEKTSRPARDVAKLFEDMLVNFPEDPQLWAEVRAMCDVMLMSDEKKDANSIFLRELFGALLPSIQCAALCRTAEASMDVLHQCRLLMLVVKHHPMQAQDQGMKLVESLLRAEKVSQCSTPVNCYRKYLACDVLPVLLRGGGTDGGGALLNVSPKHVYHWLQKVIEFYVCYITQQEQQQELTSPAPNPLSSPSATTLKSPGSGSGSISGSTAIKQTTIPGLTEEESHIVEPWTQLIQFLRLVGVHLHWNVDRFLPSPGAVTEGSSGSSLESQWQLINKMAAASFEAVSGGGAQSPADQSKQVLYYATVLYFRSVYSYALCVNHTMFGVTGSKNRTSLALIETCTPLSVDNDSSNYGTTDHRAKKARLTDSDCSPIISTSRSSLSAPSSDITQFFMTAVRCWILLYSPRFESAISALTCGDVHPLGRIVLLHQDQFSLLCLNWQTQMWTWLNSFEVDALLYEGHYRDALLRLTVIQDTLVQQHPMLFNTTSTACWQPKVRIALQMASCYYSMGDYSKACGAILHLAKMLPVSETCSTSSASPTMSSAPILLPMQDGSGSVNSRGSRQIQLIPVTEPSILSHSIHFIIACLRNKAAKSIVPEDAILGHMIVFMQFDWPRYERLFCEIVQLVKRKGHFQYTLFFNYVINIDMLEEFSYLRTPQGGNVNLTLSPVNPLSVQQVRTVTRGVNKGAVEELKISMERQVTRCDENITLLLRRFLVDESKMLINYLTI